MIQYSPAPTPVTIMVTSRTSPFTHQATACPVGARTQVYSRTEGTTTRYRVSQASPAYAPAPSAASTAPPTRSARTTACPAGVRTRAYTHRRAWPRGVSTWRYSTAAGRTTSAFPSQASTLPSGTRTYRHRPANGHTNTARTTHSDARPSGRNTASPRNLPATTSASHAIRTGTTRTSATIRTGTRIATARHPSPRDASPRTAGADFSRSIPA